MFKLIFRTILVVSMLFCLSFTGSWYLFMHQPLHVKNTEELLVKPGATVNQIAYQLQYRNILASSRWLRWWAWYRGDANKIKAGEYIIEPNLTAPRLLQKLIDGRVVQYSFTVLPGWSFQQLLQALHREKKIIHTLLNDDYSTVMQKFIDFCPSTDLFPSFTNLEGIFWPDTYFYTAGTTDLQLLHRAYNVMHNKLVQEWNERDNSTNITTPYQALILASILEKEASKPEEYYAMAGVYHRRLALNMLLQADPTLIYILKQVANFTLPLKKSDMQIDSNYNTYKYPGLPPTPIAFPSRLAIHAALHPSYSEALYFVADGYGGHVFSNTLEEHNKAVANYRNIIQQRQVAASSGQP